MDLATNFRSICLSWLAGKAKYSQKKREIMAKIAREIPSGKAPRDFPDTGFSEACNMMSQVACLMNSSLVSAVILLQRDKLPDLFLEMEGLTGDAMSQIKIHFQFNLIYWY